MSLHLFDNEEDIVAAADAEDAWVVWLEAMGELREDYDDDHFHWVQLPDDRLFTVAMPDAENGPTKETRTCAEWAAQGRCVVGSRHY